MQTLDRSFAGKADQSTALQKNESGEYSLIQKAAADYQRNMGKEFDASPSSKRFKSARMAGSAKNSPSSSRDNFRYNILYNKVKAIINESHRKEGSSGRSLNNQAKILFTQPSD